MTSKKYPNKVDAGYEEIITKEMGFSYTLTVHYCDILDVPAKQILLSTNFTYPHKKSDLISKIMREMDTSTFSRLSSELKVEREEYLKKYALPPRGNWKPNPEGKEPEFRGIYSNNYEASFYNADGRLISKVKIIAPSSKLLSLGYEKLLIAYLETSCLIESIGGTILSLSKFNTIIKNNSLVIPFWGIRRTQEKEKYFQKIKKSILDLSLVAENFDLHIATTERSIYEQAVKLMKIT